MYKKSGTGKGDDDIRRSFSEDNRDMQENGASRVILFGSRAKGTARDRSDIDIAVCGVSDMEKLQEEIEDIPTLYTIDLVDLDTCENQLLLEDIEQYGRKIYEEV